MSKRIGTFVIVGLVALFAWMGYDYLHYRAVNAVSDAAFIKSDRLAILSFKVDGKVVSLTKEENDPVEKGELLGRIDAIDFLTAEEGLRHRRAALVRKIEAAKLKKERVETSLKLKSEISSEDVEALRKRIEAGRLRIASAVAKLDKLRKDEARFLDLLQKRLIEREKYETVRTQRVALEKEIGAMRKGIEADERMVDKALKALALAKTQQKSVAELKKSIAAMEDELQALVSEIEEIRHKVTYTYLYAPFDGVIAKKFTDAPRVVESGSPIYALTDPKALYCEVLLSEKKLHGVQPGNDVTIEVDAVEGKTYHGTVESIAPTSAATFSLVPRDIASGEFTKLDQRFVVRIKLDDIEGLRAGMGATVAIARSASD
jgi:membrane fusion protein (multidrug efflux system)